MGFVKKCDHMPKNKNWFSLQTSVLISFTVSLARLNALTPSVLPLLVTFLEGTMKWLPNVM